MESHIEVEFVKEPNMEPPIMEPFSEALGGSTDDSSDDDDSDFIMDEDNLLDDPEVHMQDIYLNIDDNLEWFGDALITIDNVVMFYEEMKVINIDVLQSESSSDEGKLSKRRNKIRVAERVHINDGTQVSDPFNIFQTFSSSQEAKHRIYLHAIETRRELDIINNDKNGVRVVCKGTIPDMGILETSWIGGPSKTSWKGGPSQRNINGGPSQTGEKGGPSKKKSAVRVDESNKCPWKLLMSDMKVFREKEKALETIRVDFGGQYSILRDYLLVVQSQHPNTTVKLQMDNSSNPTSDTMIFRLGKRDFLGLDGAFMKGPYPGMILNTMGLDGNNSTYPMTYGVVEPDNYKSWTWFLKNLGDNLDLTTNSNFTFITNR
uniref:MULE transposase domain-containing protein n=1 Tax=Lactuca sativa TaxID=4236 RepID=A0A9R1XJQ7_LACSA|nr:hypothetical protein LSAT_V11C400203310 [Lactuca sativa]